MGLKQDSQSPMPQKLFEKRKSYSCVFIKLKEIVYQYPKWILMAPLLSELSYDIQVL